MKVAFQGERGAYSEAAAIAYFGGDVHLTPCGSFNEVYTCVTTANCDRGIVPIENTLAGSIHRNYDLLQRHTLSIVGEKVFRIHHCLIGHPNTVITELGKIISHPQALAQCEDYIDQLGVEREPWYDTAGAVKWLAENGTLGLCAALFVMAGLLRYLWQRAAEEGVNWVTRERLWAFIAAFTGFYVNMLSCSALYFPVTRIVFWIMAGVAVATLVHGEKESPERE